jgi:malate dehydrogenase
MPRAIAILGASGAVGSTLAAQILRSGLLESGDRLQLVGHGAASSEARLLGTRVDLMDAFDDERVEIEMVPRIEDVDADIIIIASGVSISAQCKDRREMGRANVAIFQHIAETCAQRARDAIFIVVSNPVELGVRILASRLDRNRIFGMGAQQDSLRFARAIAHDLHMSRRDVRATVLGEHGKAMVPLWSSVELLSAEHEQREKLQTIKNLAAEIPLYERVKTLQAEVMALVDAGQVAEAYHLSRRALPDARIFVQPFITVRTLNSTPNATSNATLVCLTALLAADHRVVHGQVMLDGEIEGLDGVCGIPITISAAGWRPAPGDEITPTEFQMLTEASESISAFCESVLS